MTCRSISALVLAAGCSYDNPDFGPGTASSGSGSADGTTTTATTVDDADGSDSVVDGEETASDTTDGDESSTTEPTCVPDEWFEEIPEQDNFLMISEKGNACFGTPCGIANFGFVPNERVSDSETFTSHLLIGFILPEIEAIETDNGIILELGIEFSGAAPQFELEVRRVFPGSWLEGEGEGQEAELFGASSWTSSAWPNEWTNMNGDVGDYSVIFEGEQAIINAPFQPLGMPTVEIMIPPSALGGVVPGSRLHIDVTSPSSGVRLLTRESDVSPRLHFLGC